MEKHVLELQAICDGLDLATKKKINRAVYNMLSEQIAMLYKLTNILLKGTV